MKDTGVHAGSPLSRLRPALWVLLGLVLMGVAALACASARTEAPPASAEGRGGAVASPTPASSDTPSPTPTPSASAYSATDPATWTDRQLAAQLVFCSVSAANPLGARRYSRMGVGGVVILGNGARRSLGRDLAAVVRAAPHRIRPFIASDEEGGQVQRLRHVIYPLPSARVMGGWSTSRTRATAKAYGARMRKLRISVAFAPVADLDVPGRYMSSLGRCFSPRPKVVGAHVVAWASGLTSAGVIPTVKHWPGHGWASDTHSGGGRIPSLSVLRRQDMVPFERAFDAGVPMVMVGHLQSRGLTEPRTPASLSPRALRYLRAHAGDDVVIITDSLSMGATTGALHIGVPEAAIRALKAGADLALFCSASPDKVIAAVTKAIRSGRLPRERAEASVLRILKLKAGSGLAPRPFAGGA